MTTIFNAPVPSIIFQYIFGAGYIRRFAGKSICKYSSLFATFHKVSDTFHHEYLPHMRKIKVFIQVGGCPNVSGFNASVIRAIYCAEIRLSVYIFKAESNVFHELFLIPFSCKVIVGISLFHQVTCQCSLS